MVGKKGEKQQMDGGFSEIIKKAYEKGKNESEVTIEMIMDELETDLKKWLVDY